MEIPHEIVEIAIEGYHKQLQFLSDLEQKKQLMINLPLIAKDYGASKVIPDFTYKECVKLVMQKFNFLSVYELREAYRQFYTGRTQATGAEMYRGEFNAANLGRVLAAYAKKRKSIITKYLNIKQQLRIQHQEKARKQRQKAEFEQQFPKLIEQAKYQLQHWQQVKFFWYQAAMKRGMMQLELGEGQAIFELAQQIAAKVLSIKQESPTAALKKRLGIDHNPKIIARKLAVWTKLLGKPLPQL